MPRVARGLVDGFIYHIINRGNGGQKIFHNNKDYGAFIRLILEAKTKYIIDILAYCLMPNHFHMLLLPAKAKDLSKWMQWLMTSHVRRYHRHYSGSGHIWQGRFKSFIVQNDEHLLTVLRYIEGNPVRAGLVNSAKIWKWSSHLESSKQKHRILTSAPPIELPRDWTSYVDMPLTDKELGCLRKSVNRQTPLGKSEWVVEVCKQFGLESTINPVGRPRK